MAHDFDPGYRGRFATLVKSYPGPDVYPPADFRVEWGPVFHRGRLDGSARVLVMGQDPGAHECIARRILVGEAGQRIQGFLARLGITESYVMINAFLISVYGQGGGNRHKNDPAIAAYRNRWLDALLVGKKVEAVVTLGTLARHAFELWKATPKGQGTAIAFQPITHPTYPESSSAAGQMTKSEAMKEMLSNWNTALAALGPKIHTPDVAAPLTPYGTTLTTQDLVAIPERDLPAGLPGWMRSLDAWAARKGATADEKRGEVRKKQLEGLAAGDADKSAGAARALDRRIFTWLVFATLGVFRAPLGDPEARRAR